jgi:plastocyanin
MIKPRSHYFTTNVPWVAAMLVALGACLPAPGSFAATTPATLNIDITKFAFVPKEASVVPGTKIVWTNHDEVPHTVTDKDKLFASKALDTDDKFEYAFTQEGDFEYYCVVHPYMTGIVHVRKQ